MANLEEELTPAQIEGEIEVMARKIERLRVAYEQYFQGIDRIPPHTQLKDVVRILNRLTNMSIRKTALKFRLNSQVQKFNGLRAYWQRTERDIENGKFKNHRLKAQRRNARRDKEPASAGLTAQDMAAIHAVRDAMGEEAAKKAEEERRRQRATEAGAAAEEFMRSLGVAPTKGVAMPPQTSEDDGADGPRGVSSEELAKRAEKLKAMRARLAAKGVLPGQGGAPAEGKAAPQKAAARRPAAARQADPDAKVRDVYNRLVAAKRQLNEPTDKITMDNLRKSLRKQEERVRAKHKCKDVDFDVVVKDGKAFLKPIPGS